MLFANLKCPVVRLAEFIVDHNYAIPKPPPKKQEEEERKEPILTHSLADVKNAVIQYCTFPLASSFVHTNAPLARTVLLYGASGTGKTLLTHAVATETGAVFMELSPARVVSALNSANGTSMDLKQLMLIVFRVHKDQVSMSLGCKSDGSNCNLYRRIGHSICKREEKE